MLEYREPLLTVADVTEILNVGRGTVYALIKDGKFDYIRTGKSYRIPKESFIEYIRKESGLMPTSSKA